MRPSFKILEALEATLALVFLEDKITPHFILIISKEK
nr:MAG TPA: hypothetical protein [Caudoviricetes sp.]DAS16954.1 MAG TPA: hypothetical protein [Caudoviricetes sp.]